MKERMIATLDQWVSLGYEHVAGVDVKMLREALRRYGYDVLPQGHRLGVDFSKVSLAIRDENSTAIACDPSDPEWVARLAAWVETRIGTGTIFGYRVEWCDTDGKRLAHTHYETTWPSTLNLAYVVVHARKDYDHEFAHTVKVRIYYEVRQKGTLLS